jgi:putative transposase
MQKHFSKRINRNLLHSQTVQEILQRLDSAYNRFFKKLAKRPPKFKSPEKFNSFVFKQGGNNRRRRLFELQQTYRKINNLRSDFQWKLAHDLCKQYDYIFIEDLNIEGMKRLWGKKVSDLSHSSFINKLTYVASKYEVTIHKIDKWYPSSKTCECGCINKGLSLRDRTWVCPACGAVNDRDILAARNILRKGISELESKSNSSDSNIGVSCVGIQESHSL